VQPLRKYPSGARYVNIAALLLLLLLLGRITAKRESHKQAVANGTLNARAQQQEVSNYFNWNVRRPTVSYIAS